MVSEMMNVKSNPNSTHWNIENGYVNITKEKTYPLRAFDSGKYSGLEISLDIHEKQFELICNTFNQGFLVYITVPGDERIFDDFIRLGLLEETVIMLRPKLITASEKLRKYDPNQRKCFFNSERKLKFYKTYTQRNCLEECFANLTKSRCNCAKFSKPSNYN